MACFGMAMMCCVSLTACSSDDDDDENTETTAGGGSSGTGAGEAGSVALAEQQIVGTWVYAAEYSQWNYWMNLGNTERASQVCQDGFLLSSGNTGAWISTRLNNNFKSWKYRTEFTWKLLNWTWKEKPNSGSGKILITINGIGSIYEIYYAATNNIGTSQLYMIDGNGNLVNDDPYTRVK